jgi:glycosyltransferase involved in cell wall biosynthesis
MIKNSLRHLDMILHPSQFSLTKHREMGLTNPATVLPYFHAPPTRAAKTEPMNGETPYFLYVGRLEPLKGPQTLVPFFRNYPRARLVVVGEGSQSQVLREMAKASPNIEFLGWLDHSQIVSIYRDATAILIPSLCYEAGPLVPIEGFLYGTPSIGRRLGTLPELLEGTGGGLIYSDDESLRAALDELLDNPERRSELGARGRAAYCKNFTPEAHLTRYFEIIDELVQSKNRLKTKAA